MLLGTNVAIVNSPNGGIWFDGSRVQVRQLTRTFNIPQINQTNATVSASTTMTWSFVYPFADTNYSVTVTGAGATLNAPIVGAKLTNSVVLSYSNFTGIINATATRQ